MTEAAFQAKLIKQYEAQGWYVLKLMQTNKNGIPDLLLLKPTEVRFVEVKKEGGKLSGVQKYRHRELFSEGFDVTTVWPDGSTTMNLDTLLLDK